MKREIHSGSRTILARWILMTVSAAAAAQAAVDLPFIDEFSSNPFTKAAYVHEAEAAVSFTHDGRRQRITAKGTGGSGNFALATAAARTEGAGFTVASMQVLSNHENNQMALYALVDGAQTGVNAASGYTANFRTSAGLRIYADGAEVSAEPWGGASSGVFDLTFSGAYNASGALELTFTVSDGAIIQSVRRVIPSPRAGRFFGLGGRVLGASGGREIRFENFSLTESEKEARSE